MNKLKGKVQQIVKSITNHAIRKEMEEWPPKCQTSIFYQPKRPSLPQQASKTQRP